MSRLPDLTCQTAHLLDYVARIGAAIHASQPPTDDNGVTHDDGAMNRQVVESARWLSDCQTQFLDVAHALSQRDAHAIARACRDAQARLADYRRFPGASVFQRQCGFSLEEGRVLLDLLRRRATACGVSSPKEEAHVDR